MRGDFVINQANQAISRVKHPDKYQCLKLCMQKESEGWECVRSIQKVNKFTKHFSYDGRDVLFRGFTDDGYYEAIYRKKFR